MDGWMDSLLDGWLDRRVGGIGKWVGKQVNEWRIFLIFFTKPKTPIVSKNTRMTKAK